jgi:hypothetical protein
VIISQLLHQLNFISNLNWSFANLSFLNDPDFEQNPTKYWGLKYEYEKQQVEIEIYQFDQQIKTQVFHFLSNALFHYLEEVEELKLTFLSKFTDLITQLLLITLPKRSFENESVESFDPNPIFEKIFEKLQSASFEQISVYLTIFSKLSFNFNYSTYSIQKYRSISYTSRQKLKSFFVENQQVFEPRMFVCLLHISNLQWIANIKQVLLFSILDKIIPFLFHENREASIQAGSILLPFVFNDETFRETFFSELLNRLGSQKCSEFEIKGIFRFFSNLPLMFVIKNTPLLVRLLTITVSFPYVQKWGITPFLTTFINSLEEYRPNEQVSFSQEWNDLQNYLSTIQPTIGHRNFVLLFDFVFFKIKLLHQN